MNNDWLCDSCDKLLDETALVVRGYRAKFCSTGCAANFFLYFEPRTKESWLKENPSERGINESAIKNATAHTDKV